MPDDDRRVFESGVVSLSGRSMNGYSAVAILIVIAALVFGLPMMFVFAGPLVQ